MAKVMLCILKVSPVSNAVLTSNYSFKQHVNTLWPLWNSTEMARNEMQHQNGGQTYVYGLPGQFNQKKKKNLF